MKYYFCDAPDTEDVDDYIFSQQEEKHESEK